ncbi:peptidylprolyl isomerase [Pelagibacterales bacterium SAG-MED38]|nr:peptidylprolyl isomerase [Pelagibacterales bacterium SAG-MED38]
MKIDNQIITNYDLEKEANYLLALNPSLKEIDKIKLMTISKRSLVKEKIRKNEILKYKTLDNESVQIEAVLNRLVLSLDFENQDQFQEYLKKFDLSINDLKEKIEIENEWKNLVYAKFFNSVKIDKSDLARKIEKMSKKKFLVEYNLSEILFTKKKNFLIEVQIDEIKESIEKIGFENTANLFSISDSSKIGGKIGWVRENNLSKEVNKNLKKLKLNSYSEPIRIGNNFLILKINEIKQVPIEVDKKKELDKIVMIETTKQLDKFSNIFYDKIKLNSKISEF